MGVEIERKFLVINDDWRAGASSRHCVQAYLAFGPPVSVRIRIMGDKATLNIKTALVGITRGEFEYGIPLDDAKALLAGSCVGAPIDKTRYLVHHAGAQWEVDEFHGANAGLIIAEIELERDDQPFDRPSWLGEEVSHDPRYLNTHLSRHPYTEWEETQSRAKTSSTRD